MKRFLVVAVVGLLGAMEARAQGGPPPTPPQAGPPPAHSQGDPQLAQPGGPPPAPPQGGPLAAPAQGDPQLGQKALAILKTNCGKCHGPDGTNEGGFNYVLDVQQLVARKKIVPGDPDKSKLFKKVASGEMPPEDEKVRPSKDDIGVLAAWIKTGSVAPVIVQKVRPFKTERDNLLAIRAHLRKLVPEDRVYQRYFTLTNIFDNKRYSDDDLRIYRAALAKFINHLSWKHGIVIPDPIDPEETVFAVDIRGLDWDRCHLWSEITRVYPYGLSHDHDADDELRDIFGEIYHDTGTSVPAIRADWFIATASQPPLYHTLLFEVLMGLPHDFGAREVEYKLGINVFDDILHDKVARAGFTTSGVSQQNRMIERHEAPYGAYWKSYDFKSNDGRGNLFRFPLGPIFDHNPFNDQAFEQAGGEIIFNLPNGLQGYLLVDGKDRRIDRGPITVVSDSLHTGGTAEVINGVSCMACHSRGMKLDFRDTVRDGHSLNGDGEIKVRRLYLPPPPMERQIKDDEDRFVQAADRAMGRFLRVGPDQNPKVQEVTTEPIGVVARAYILRELCLDDVACELGIPDPKIVAVAIQTNDHLRELGIGPLAIGATIKREVWESLERLNSPFQITAYKLRLGTPVHAR